LARDLESRLLPIAREATPEEIAEMARKEKMIEEEAFREGPPLDENNDSENPPFIAKPLAPADFEKREIPHINVPEESIRKETTEEEKTPDVPPKKEEKKSQDVYREPV